MGFLSKPNPTPKKNNRIKSTAAHLLESSPPRDFVEEFSTRGLMIEFYRVLPSFTEFYRVLPSFTEFYRVLPSLPSFTEFYRVLPSFTEFYRVLPSFTEAFIWCCRVLQRNAEFYGVSLC